ncbi:MAG: NUDIX domain-containing protein [Planctomycetaceae bacterium]|nr:NUDIX domain-containing protein [Planctomycetaceae bacterium]
MDNSANHGGRTEFHSCGFLLLKKNQTNWQFLLLRHADRWDLPKGLCEIGETPLGTAFRELREETGIPESMVQVLKEFEYCHRYRVTGFDGQPTNKQLTIFLGIVSGDPQIALTEHLSYRWFDWKPPHQIEPKNVDQVLAALEKFGWPH